MAFCTHCGNQLPEVAAFCPKCGTKIVKLEIPTPPVAPEVPYTPSQNNNTCNNDNAASNNFNPAYGGTPLNNGPTYDEAPTNNGASNNSYNNNYGGGSEIPPASPSGSNGIFSKDTMEMIVQIAAIVFALFNVYLAYRYGIKVIFSLLSNILSHFNFKGIVCNLLYIISGVACAATAVVYFTGLVAWKKENASRYVLSAAVTSLLAIIGNLLGCVAKAVFWGKIYASSSEIFVTWLKFSFFMILALAIWIVLMYVARINVIESINTKKIIDEVKESLFFIIDELKKFIEANKAKRPAPAPASAASASATSYSQPNTTTGYYYSAPADNSATGMNNQMNGNPINNNYSYGAPRPFRLMKTDRNFFVVMLLSIITCGIYGIIFEYQFCEDMNIVCDGDGEHTPNFFIIVLLSFVTCGIYGLVAYYKMAERIYRNGQRYGCMITNTGSTFLLWTLVGYFLCGLGPYIAIYKRIDDFNHLCVAYNSYQQ